MATIIDSLIVKLGLDGSGFGAGMKSANKDLDKTKQQAKDAAAAIAQMKSEAVRFMGVMLGAAGLEQLVTRLTDTNAKLAMLSRNLGTSTQTLQAWGNAAEQVNGTADGMYGTFTSLSKVITEMQVTGNTAMLPFLRSMGISLADAEGKARPLDDILRNMSEWASGQDRTHAANIFAMMGLDQGTANLLLEGPGRLDAIMKRQKDMSLLTKEQAENSLKLKASWMQLQQEGTALANQILGALTPAMSNLLEWMSENRTVVIALGAAFGVWMVSMNPIAAIIGGISAAIVALIDDYQTWKKGGDSLINWEIWGKGVDMAIKAVGILGDKLHDAWDWATKLSDATFGGTAVGDWIGEKTAQGLAALGSKTAQESLDRMAGKTVAAPAARGGSPAAMFAGLEKQYGLPSGLLDSVWAVESGRGKNMRSPAGAMGHFQFMPKTAQEFGLKNPDDLRESANAAARKYAGLIKMFNGDVSMAVAAYNWGEGNVQRQGMVNAPAETRGYVAKVVQGLTPGATSSGGRTMNSEVNIDHITVVTQATNAQGIARDLTGALRNQGLTYQADSGLY